MKVGVEADKSNLPPKAEAPSLLWAPAPSPVMGAESSPHGACEAEIRQCGEESTVNADDALWMTAALFLFCVYFYRSNIYSSSFLIKNLQRFIIAW